MTTLSSGLDLSKRGRLLLLSHGGLIAVIGLISGFGYVFSILDSITVWPITFSSEISIPGSEQGWRVAHVAGVMNGLMMMIAGLALGPIAASRIAQRWIVGGMIYTGWGNTIFFHCANLSNNRALTAGPSKFGDADIFGVVGYLVGASTIPFTIAALLLISHAAYRKMMTG